ncbi:General transcription factor II-I repeat domain-containing protein 2B [Merluccius polli]|uniref:General transcription factor II-I repeat domain-containing protein 2B n=1 Tax=Merluccius polli TaxID=89951 RepID=A0AA47N752_MERPO|nr:General transcription factor II-I repeat domain-containing protein 2B [Merluccius polli]
MGVGHVMTPVAKIINPIQEEKKAKQHRSFKLFLEEMSAEELFHQTEVRWLSKDVTENLNHLNQQLHGKDKTICDMFSAVKTFKAKLSFYLQQVKNKRLQPFPSVVKMLESHAVDVLVGHKYSDLSKLGQEFEDKFNDFDKLEPCVAFIANTFMEVDIGEISEQMAELFSVNPVEMENRPCLVDPEIYKNIHQAALKESALFGSTYLCEAAFSDMNVMKSKFITSLTDEHIN